MSRIENITDQLKGFTQEVEVLIDYYINEGYKVDQAIKIVELGIKNIEVEVNHHKEYQFGLLNENLERISDKLSLIIDRMDNY